jgi:glycosyltransferase involved in cell wall biosynthesis
VNEYESLPDLPAKGRRVLCVENGIGYGGAIICLRHLVRNLDPSRYEAMIVTGRVGPLYSDIANDAPWQGVLDRRLDVTRMRSRVDESVFLKKVPGLLFVVRQAIARIDDLVNLLPFMIGFARVVRRFRPDLIHVNNEPLCNRGALLVAKLAGIPTVCHVRGDQEGSIAMRWLYRLPSHFAPVSHWVSENIGRLGVPQARRTVVYDGLELEKLDTGANGAAFREAHAIPGDAFAVGLVGLLIPWKGQRIFVEAAKLLRDRIPNLRMLIIGGTPDECRDYEAELRQRVAREGLSEIVVFTGHSDDMPRVYNGLDVVVSASTSPEPLGTVVIESMTMARPLVAPSHGGAIEMATHDETALLFAPGNAGDLARQIARLHDEPATATRLSEAARIHALATFDVATHAEKVQTIYDTVLAEQPDQPPSSK